MAEQKPKVVAFYREHPTLAEIAEQMKQAESTAAMKSDWHMKALAKIRKDAVAEGKEIWKRMNAELVRLELITQQEIDNGHLHVDTETMTIQRC